MALVRDVDMTDRWRAAWAWSQERGGPELTVRRFRRTFGLGDVPDEFVVHVSADSRYKLFCNGRRVGRGPLKDNPDHYQFDSYDLAEMLRPGTNVLAAEVYWFGLNAPRSEEHTGYAGLLVQGPEGAGVDTPGDWRVHVDRAVQADTTSYIANAQTFLDHTERVDGRELPRGWEQPEFDDADWEQAVAVWPAGEWIGASEEHSIWELAPREMPLLVEEPRRFARTIVDMAPADHLFGDPPKGWRLEAGQAGEIVLDAGMLTTGYPELTFEGGAGRTVEVIYGECIGRWPEGGRYGRQKGVRDDLSFGDVDGYRDTLILPGGAMRWEPMHWRTFWFVRVKVSAGPEAVELADFTYRFTTYPQELKATFDCSAPDMDRIMEMSFRTLQLCSHETYEDCPYYEQLNYIFDSHNEALVSYAMAGETELARRVIRLFRDSLRSDGLVYARVPSRRKLPLPHFAPIWVDMVDDYWRWTGDRAFVRECLFAVEGVLWWFRNLVADDGLVRDVPFWQAGCTSPVTYTCFWLYAMQRAMRMHREAGQPSDADRWAPWAERARAVIHDDCWDDERGVFMTDPRRPELEPATRAQIYGILTGAADEEQKRRAGEWLASRERREPGSNPASYFRALALEECGMFDRFETTFMGGYRAMLDLHLSTWLEHGTPGRSDCHAWNAWPPVCYLTIVLGIKPLKPGFRQVLVRPQVVYDWARGSMPTPVGDVRVDWRRDGGRVVLEGEAPAGVPVQVELPNAAPQRFEAGGRFAAEAPLG